MLENQDKRVNRLFLHAKSASVNAIYNCKLNILTVAGSVETPYLKYITFSICYIRISDWHGCCSNTGSNNKPKHGGQEDENGRTDNQRK